MNLVCVSHPRRFSLSGSFSMGNTIPDGEDHQYNPAFYPSSANIDHT
ncbi:hypothetical protein [Niastella populi]|nr:hypothetical protein [Niastella populi]